MEGKVGRQCRIRKRGCSSSSSSSLVRQYRFKRAILVRKRAGSSTPVPTWKMSTRSPSLAMPNIEFPKCLPSGKGKDMSVSARKLAATLWEINEVPSPQEKKGVEKLTGRKELKSTQRVAMLSKSGPLPQPLSDSSYSHGSEIEAHSRGKVHTGCTIGIKTRLKDLSNGLTTSKELLKVLYRVSGFEQQHSSSISLVAALRAELDQARVHVEQLIREQKSSCNEIEYVVKQFSQEKAASKTREQGRIHDVIACIAEELEAEKKLRRQTERLNKKLGKELADTKASLSKALKELESEKRAKEILEQVCDELARGIGDDRAQAEQLKRESEKLLAEVEKEREMLQLADVLREERVQMKLAEARYQFEEKNAIVEKLKSELEAFLESKRGKENGNESPKSEKSRQIENLLRKTDLRLFFDADEEDRGDIADVSPKSERTQELEAFLRQNHIGLCQNAERNISREALYEDEHKEDGDSEDSDLHSIELNMDSNSKSYKWSYAPGAGAGNDLKRFSVEKIIKGRNSNAEKVQRGNILLERENSFDICWDVGFECQKTENVRSPELSSHVQTPKNEDEVKKCKSVNVKCIRDDILSASRFTSVQSFATSNPQWGQSLPLEDSGSEDWENLMILSGNDNSNLELLGEQANV